MNKKYSRILREFAETIALTTVVFLFLVTFIIQGYKVDGTCMEPNLSTGQRLLGNKFIYRFEHPVRGDVIVFQYPPDPRKTFIKRIIGMPGETVEIRAGKVYVDGRKLDERPYVKNTPHGDFPRQTIPRDSVFVLGDNRDQSNDSRYWGYLPLKNIQAKAWLRYWPASRMTAFR